jgi:putative ABC transport system permease protein
LIGVGAGLASAGVAGRLLASSLYGVRALDVGVLASVAATAAVVILLATYLAARRALSIEPVEAMRVL